ncbi:MAG TPA: DNA-deoxyinosine glycosylase [Methanoregula sp.]|nr:DNA-deoxyinosine glycosylase [Methanoregula sp.]
MPGTSNKGSPACTRVAGLPPVTGRYPRILILGSFPGRRSLLQNEYYGNPLNQFWKIADNLLAVPAGLPYLRRRALLMARGIALWDIIRSCCREGSADNRIRNPRFNDIGAFVSRFPSIRFIALNGSTAGRFFRQLDLPGSLPSEILPSTSPANTRYSFAQKADRWSIIARYL